MLDVITLTSRKRSVALRQKRPGARAAAAREISGRSIPVGRMHVTPRAGARSGRLARDQLRLDQLRHGHQLVLTERSADADHANHPVVLGEAEASDSSSSLEELGPGEPGDDRSDQIGVARRFCPARRA